MATGTQRKTADERRAEIVDAAFAEFADRGLHGTSTDAIAARAGVSQPYLFRLFGTKKDLFLAAVERCYEVTLATFVGAAEGKRGDDAMKAMGAAYIGLLSDRRKLRMQLQAQAACDDPDVREVVRRHFGELVDFVERASGADASRVRDFFAVGMLLNVIAAMDLLDDEDGWAKRFLALSRKRG